ncbi:TPA: hypothetical protein ACPH36_006560 [Pseudomonas aeruginosa]|uniref:hypothetical protein n=1 Tax=Pseudomonas sp. HMSC066A08 TaxID=1739390 RepID=UPI000AD4EEA6|nr:hypothetical protein [Pseudomonas sp. HMSC066A08]
MTKANECTCPSGDGSLRHPCPAHPASVELAGVAAKLTFINGRPAMCGCQVEYSSGGGEYSDVIYVTLCAKHSGSAILDLVATNRIALTPEYEGQWHADLYLDREIPLAKAEGATPAEAVLALMSAERIDPEQESVEQAGGDERDFQAEGAQEVPSPVSQEYDRHLISLLRKGEALPGHQEEAADEIERLRDWNDHLNNTVLPNILNPNFLMLMKGGERLLDLCTKDGKFIGVSLNDMKDVFDWMVTHARIAPDHAALAQPSPAQAEQAEVERLDWLSALLDVAVLQEALTSRDSDERMKNMDAGEVIRRAFGKLTEIRAQHERIVGALRTKADQLREALEWRKENQAGQRELLRSVTAERDAALARVAELEKQEPAGAPMPDEIHQMAFEEGQPAEDGDGYIFSAEEFDLFVQRLLDSCAAPVAQAQHSVPDGYALVPLEPTDDMLVAGQEAWTHKMERRGALEDCEEAGDVYRAMLAAAPGKEGL